MRTRLGTYNQVTPLCIGMKRLFDNASLAEKIEGSGKMNLY